MGVFRIEIEAVGGHSCQRAPSNAGFKGCGGDDCPDCSARMLVALLRMTNCFIMSAKLIYRPGVEGSTTDDLLSGLRSSPGGIL